ncbi:hypothetical protein HA402_012586 [Bradysia odoriphaga]|nr:hypothetical protein HA402_012586 [Bradysia odoriphaga]
MALRKLPNRNVKKDKVTKETNIKGQIQPVVAEQRSDENVSISKQLPQPDPPIKKMERSHSFFLTRKLSKIYNTLTGSKENLTKIPENENEEPVFKFSRSLSLATIPLRKSYRRIVRETKLEKLHEEHPEKVDEHKEETAEVSNEPLPYNDENASPTRERSNSFLSQLKRTFSSSSDKKKPLNPKWSASLANLQQIDVMVSYEDLSFINYDKFNTYEKNLIKPVEGDYLQRAANNRMSMDERMLKKYYRQKSETTPKVSTETETTILDTAAATANPVVRRRKNNRVDEVRKSAYLDSNIDSNFDQSRNVYRNSLDEAKLKFLNKVNRDSFRLSNNFERTAEEVLMLDNYLSGNAADAPDTVDGVNDGNVSIVPKRVKSVDFAESVRVADKCERSYDRHHSLYLPKQKMTYLEDTVIIID